MAESPEPTPPSQRQPTKIDNPLRQDRIDIYEGLNKVTLVPGSSAIGKRGKGVGFYCEACNLTYKDSIQYLDHLNSKQHQYATGVKDSAVPVATLEDVRKRLKYLVDQKKAELLKQSQAGGSELFNIQARIEQRKKLEEDERVKRQQARAEKKRRQKKRKREGEGSGSDQDEGNEERKKQAQDMATLMGFSNFGTSSKA